jgi:hypothetical protein
MKSAQFNSEFHTIWSEAAEKHKKDYGSRGTTTFTNGARKRTIDALLAHAKGDTSAFDNARKCINAAQTAAKK